MKSKCIIPLFLSIVSFCSAQALYLYTPKGSQVYVFQNSEMSVLDIAYITAECASLYPNAEVLANASATYNCHSYAWNLTAGSTIQCWMNQYFDPPYNTVKNLHYYWEDGSYEQTTEVSAVKIFYYEGDHSAVKSTSHPGKYESKWGRYPLVRHSPEYGPYTNMQNRRYYQCSPVNFINKTITANTSITSPCSDIIVQNITVTNDATLTINTTENVNIQNVTVMSNAKLIIRAKNVDIQQPFDVQIGAELDIVAL